MNESLRLTALFVRDLLGYNEQLIRIGRQNYDIDDFNIGYIGVDSLGAAQRLASGEKYDGNTERMSFQPSGRRPCRRAVERQRNRRLPLLLEAHALCVAVVFLTARQPLCRA